MTTTKGSSTRRSTTPKRVAGTAAALLTIGSASVWLVSKSRAQAHAQSQVQTQANPAATATTGASANTNTSQSNGNTQSLIQYIGGGAKASKPSTGATLAAMPAQSQGNAPLKTPPPTQMEIEAEAFQLLVRAIDEYPRLYHGVDLGVVYNDCTHRYKAIQGEAEAARHRIHSLGIAAKRTDISRDFLAQTMTLGIRYAERCDHTLAFEK